MVEWSAMSVELHALRERTEGAARLAYQRLHHLGRSRQVVDQPHALPSVHGEELAVLLLRGLRVDVLSGRVLEERGQDGRAGGRVTVGEDVPQCPRVEPGEGIGDRGRLAALLENGFLPELGSHGVTGGDETGAEEHA